MVMVAVAAGAMETGVAGERTMETGWHAWNEAGTEKTPLMLALINAVPG